MQSYTNQNSSGIQSLKNFNKYMGKNKNFNSMSILKSNRKERNPDLPDIVITT